jgi:hypothetical protein
VRQNHRRILPAYLSTTPMKIIPVSFRRGPLMALVATFVLLAGAAPANAQTVYLTFSGGGGTPFVVSWSTPITYTLTSSTTNSGVNPYFVFQNISGIEAPVPVDTVATFSGAPTYTSTGAGSGDGTQTINSFYTTNAHGVVGNEDLVFRATADTAISFLTAGDVISLTAGSLHNSTNYSGAMPVSGYYNTFITDASYQPNLGAGSAIPEPSTYAAFAGAAMLGFVAWRRRKTGAVKSAA